MLQGTDHTCINTDEGQTVVPSGFVSVEMKENASRSHPPPSAYTEYRVNHPNHIIGNEVAGEVNFGATSGGGEERVATGYHYDRLLTSSPSSARDNHASTQVCKKEAAVHNHQVPYHTVGAAPPQTPPPATSFSALSAGSHVHVHVFSLPRSPEVTPTSSFRSTYSTPAATATKKMVPDAYATFNNHNNQHQNERKNLTNVSNCPSITNTSVHSVSLSPTSPPVATTDTMAREVVGKGGARKDNSANTSKAKGPLDSERGHYQAAYHNNGDRQNQYHNVHETRRGPQQQLTSPRPLFSLGLDPSTGNSFLLTRETLRSEAASDRDDSGSTNNHHRDEVATVATAATTARSEKNSVLSAANAREATSGKTVTIFTFGEISDPAGTHHSSNKESRRSPESVSVLIEDPVVKINKGGSEDGASSSSSHHDKVSDKFIGNASSNENNDQSNINDNGKAKTKRRVRISLLFVLAAQVLLIVGTFIGIISATAVRVNTLTASMVTEKVRADLTFANQSILSPVLEHERTLFGLRDRYLTKTAQTGKEQCSDDGPDYAFSADFLTDAALLRLRQPNLVYLFHIRRSSRYFSKTNASGPLGGGGIGFPELVGCATIPTGVLTMSNRADRFSLPVTRDTLEKNRLATLPFFSLPTRVDFLYALVQFGTPYLSWNTVLSYDEVSGSANLYLIAFAPNEVNRTDPSTGAFVEQFRPELSPRVVDPNLIAHSLTGLAINFTSFVTILNAITPKVEGAHTTVYNLDKMQLLSTNARDCPLYHGNGTLSALFVAGRSPSPSVNEAFNAMKVSFKTSLTVPSISNGGSLFKMEALRFEVNLDVNGRVISSAPIVTTTSGLNFVVVQSTPRSHYFTESTSIRDYLIVVGVIVGAAILLVCVFVGVSIRIPVIQLRAGMELAAAMKNHKVQPTTSYLSDLDALCVAFDQMNAKLMVAREFMPQALLFESSSNEEDDDDDEDEDHSDEDDYNSEGDYSLYGSENKGVEGGGAGSSSKQRRGGRGAAIRDKMKKKGARVRGLDASRSEASSAAATSSTLSTGPLTLRGGKNIAKGGEMGAKKLNRYVIRGITDGNSSSDLAVSSGYTTDTTTAATNPSLSLSPAAMLTVGRRGGGAAGAGGGLKGTIMVPPSTLIPQQPGGPASSLLQLKRVTILVINVRDFHKKIQMGVPSSVVEPATQLATLISTICNREKGVIDSFHGDHFVLSFNAAKNNAQGPVKAARCALDIIDEVTSIQQSERESDTKKLVGDGGAAGKRLVANGKSAAANTSGGERTSGGFSSNNNNTRSQSTIHSNNTISNLSAIPTIKRMGPPTSFPAAAPALTQTKLLSLALSGGGGRQSPPPPLFTFSMGVSSGRAYVGHLGTSGMKRLSIVGRVYSRAVAMERACRRINSELATSGSPIFNEKLRHEMARSLEMTMTAEAEEKQQHQKGEEENAAAPLLTSIAPFSGSDSLAEKQQQQQKKVAAASLTPPIRSEGFVRGKEKKIGTYVYNSGSGGSGSSKNAPPPPPHSFFGSVELVADALMATEIQHAFLLQTLCTVGEKVNTGDNRFLCHHNTDARSRLIDSSYANNIVLPAPPHHHKKELEFVHAIRGAKHRSAREADEWLYELSEMNNALANNNINNKNNLGIVSLSSGVDKVHALINQSADRVRRQSAALNTLGDKAIGEMCLSSINRALVSYFERLQTLYEELKYEMVAAASAAHFRQPMSARKEKHVSENDDRRGGSTYAPSEGERNVASEGNQPPAATSNPPRNPSSVPFSSRVGQQALAARRALRSAVLETIVTYAERIGFTITDYRPAAQNENESTKTPTTRRRGALHLLHHLLHLDALERNEGKDSSSPSALVSPRAIFTALYRSELTSSSLDAPSPATRPVEGEGVVMSTTTTIEQGQGQKGVKNSATMRSDCDYDEDSLFASSDLVSASFYRFLLTSSNLSDCSHSSEAGGKRGGNVLAASLQSIAYALVLSDSEDSFSGVLLNE